MTSMTKRPRFLIALTVLAAACGSEPDQFGSPVVLGIFDYRAVGALDLGSVGLSGSLVTSDFSLQDAPLRLVSP